MLGGAIPVGSPLHRAVGCTACNTEGYRGRGAIYEMIEVDASMQGLIHDGASEADLVAAARRHGPALIDDGAAKIAAGVTTVEEVARVVRDDG
jgi:general secretion pathway protein E